VTAPAISDDEREALEMIVLVMSDGHAGMFADYPMDQDLADRLAARGLIDGEMMPGDVDEDGQPIERVAYWLTPAGELALGNGPWSPPPDATQWDCPDCGAGWWLTEAEATKGCPADHPERCGAALARRSTPPARP
jgi:hypothetical protein